MGVHVACKNEEDPIKSEGTGVVTTFLQLYILIRHKLYEIISPGRRGTLIFSHIHRLSLFFWLKIRYFHIFWGMKILWIFLGGHHKIGLV